MVYTQIQKFYYHSFIKFVCRDKEKKISNFHQIC